MDEDMILPDDFKAPVQESVEDTTPTEQETDGLTESETSQETEPEAETSPFLKVKYNKEELELDEARARELAQKGLNYDKVTERLQALESDPRLSLVDELAKENEMSVDEFLQAVRQNRDEQRLNELLQQNIPEEYAREMLENRKFREQMEQERKAKQQEEQQNAEYKDFFDYYREANGKDFNPNQDEIPQSVWEANAQGIPLKYAFMQHENNQLRQQLSTLKQNESNAQKAPVGSTTAHGGTENASEDLFMQGFNSI